MLTWVLSRDSRIRLGRILDQRGVGWGCASRCLVGMPSAADVVLEILVSSSIPGAPWRIWNSSIPGTSWSGEGLAESRGFSVRLFWIR